jgi:hypothetical protein
MRNSVMRNPSTLPRYNQQADQAIDASSWIIPTDDLDYDIAIGELLSLQQKRLPPETITA